MKLYPQIGPIKNLPDLFRVVETVVKERKQDIQDFNNLRNTYIAGRKVGKIPTGAIDVDPALDKVGDFNIADDSGTTYLYALVDISGTAEWRRVALSSW